MFKVNIEIWVVKSLLGRGIGWSVRAVSLKFGEVYGTVRFFTFEFW